jgi:hypothetical protein
MPASRSRQVASRRRICKTGQVLTMVLHFSDSGSRAGSRLSLVCAPRGQRARPARLGAQHRGGRRRSCGLRQPPTWPNSAPACAADRAAAALITSSSTISMRVKPKASARSGSMARGEEDRAGTGPRGSFIRLLLFAVLSRALSLLILLQGSRIVPRLFPSRRFRRFSRSPISRSECTHA